MKARSPKGLRHCLNALLLIAPAWFFYASLTPPATPAAWSSETIGPWTLTPAPADDGPPYVHDGARIKDFRFRTCAGCAAQMRSGVARVAVTAPALGPDIDGIVHGHGDHLEAHVPWPEQISDDHRLWVTVQDWSGKTHSASWPLERRTGELGM